MALVKKDYNYITANNTIALYTYIIRKITFYIILLNK